MNWFGRKKTQESAAPRPAASSKAAGNGTMNTIKNNKEKVLQMEKRIKFLEGKIQITVKDARARLKKGDKKGATFCVKRKKMWEKEVSRLHGMMINLEQQGMALESAQTNVSAMATMQSNAGAMKSIQKDVNIEKVEDVTAELEDAMHDADEVADLMSNPIGGFEEDEDDLLAELDGMEADEFESEMMGEAAPAAAAPVAAIPAMPSAPSGEVEVADDDAAELAALEAEMM